jgi:hypothetical protein
MSVTQVEQESTPEQALDHASQSAITFWRVASAILVLVDMTAASFGVSVIIEASRAFGLISGLVIFVTVAVTAGVVGMSWTFWKVVRHTLRIDRTIRRRQAR